MTHSSLEFFNRLSTDYDEVISRSVPRYREMFWAMLYYLPQDFDPQSILELGCGTGNLTLLLHERWPQANITVVDFSPEMLHQTADKLQHSPQLTGIQASFEHLDLPANSFELVISSIAIHHILDPAKEQLIHRIFKWLRPDSFFVLADQVRGTTDRLYQADLTYYESYAQEQGAPLEDILQWREHRETMDHYATLANLTQWMTDAGFQDVDTLWRYCFWAVLQARRP